jgi:hypothetical protein
VNVPDRPQANGGGTALRPAVARGPRVRHRFGIRQELRFNDLRGTKVTEMVWAGVRVPDLAIRLGRKVETAAKVLGVYAALNPGRATVVALPARSKRDDATS